MIISEKRDKKVKKYAVKNVPYPFTSREQYEKSLRNPLGQTWNTVGATKAMTEPAVTTRAGIIIAPMRLDKKQQQIKSQM